MTKPDRWMPLDWGDYWRDTGHLTAAEHGAYLNLIGHYWVSGKALPDDDIRLHRLARMGFVEWRKVSATVRAFFVVGDGLLKHKRIDQEIERANDVHAKRSQAAKRTNAKRYAERALSDTQSQSQSQLDSGPTGPGANAPSGEGGDVHANLFGEAETASLKARIFGPCLVWLAAQSKLPDAGARRLVGKWCSQFGDGAVLDAFTAAARQSPLDPVPYIERVLSNVDSSKSGAQALRGGAQQRQAAPVFQERVAGAARHQATGHLAGLRDALGLGYVAPARPDAQGTDAGVVIDADREPDTGAGSGG
jgi:uncharacterized protein YdaU (DUF1376 family)